MFPKTHGHIVRVVPTLSLIDVSILFCGFYFLVLVYLLSTFNRIKTVYLSHVKLIIGVDYIHQQGSYRFRDPSSPG